MVGLPILNGGGYKPAYGHWGAPLGTLEGFRKCLIISVGGWDQLVRWVY